MRTLNISISEFEFNKFGIKKDSLAFTEFVELVSRELMKQNHNKCVELAEKYELSTMAIDEINEEVKAWIFRSMLTPLNRNVFEQ
ncbi:hypothetical protein [Aquiflexum lacus]|uniref:hypothetical protein n=1 Tax=Aquiflexum lacus TaxID=2483805 RepID=UPI001895C584|nr:hypothetical protein [Aquiflexum lacus]